MQVTCNVFEQCPDFIKVESQNDLSSYILSIETSEKADTGDITVLLHANDSLKDLQSKLVSITLTVKDPCED